MAIREFSVDVTLTVLVKLDDEKLNAEFNEEFQKYMWKIDSIEDHAKYLAQLAARGLIEYRNFVEGYGDLKELGCSVEITDQSEECEACEAITWGGVEIDH